MNEVPLLISIDRILINLKTWSHRWPQSWSHWVCTPWGGIREWSGLQPFSSKWQSIAKEIRSHVSYPPWSSWNSPETPQVGSSPPLVEKITSKLHAMQQEPIQFCIFSSKFYDTIDNNTTTLEMSKFDALFHAHWTIMPPWSTLFTYVGKLWVDCYINS